MSEEIALAEKVRYQPLHVHSRVGSVLDGLSSVESIVKRHIEIDAPAVCITDHAYATAHFELSKLCEKYNIKPIFAVEGYLAPKEGYLKSKVPDYKDYYHLTLIAMNEIGYKNLMKISYHSFKDNFYRKPRYDFELLEKYNEGLICLQACLGSSVSQFILGKREEEAKEWMTRFKSIFGDRYYSELTWTNLKEQEYVNPKIVELSEELGIKVVITPDSHYTSRKDSDIHKALVCINTNSPFVPSLEKVKEGEDVDEGGMFYTPGQYYLKSAEELINDYYHSIPKHLEYFQNTLDIADRIKWIKFDTSKKFPVEYVDSLQELKRRIVVGLNEKIKSGILNIEDREVYLKRVEEELSVISRMNFCDYFIMIQNIIKWANEQGITTGPGRGCLAPDSLVLTPNGYKKISLIRPEEYVYTHTGKLQKVIANTKHKVSEDMIEVSTFNALEPVYMTLDHKIYLDTKEFVPSSSCHGSFAFYPFIEPDYSFLKTLIRDDFSVSVLAILAATAIKDDNDDFWIEDLSAIKEIESLNPSFFDSCIPNNGSFKIAKTFSELLNKICRYSSTTNDLIEILPVQLGKIYSFIFVCKFLENYSGAVFNQDDGTYYVNIESESLANSLLSYCNDAGLRARFNGKSYSYHHIEVDFEIERDFQKVYDDGISNFLKIKNIKVTGDHYVYDLMVEEDNSFITPIGAVHNSGAGSFINFLLDITRVNPLEYDLLFFRMLNSGRTPIPQIQDLTG